MKDVKIQKSKTDMREQARANNGRKHRKKRKKNFTLYYILLLFFLFVVGATLSVTVFFNIDEIKVQGISRYSQEEIVQASGVHIGQNLLRLNTAKIEEKLLQQLGYCDKVTVKRSLPATLSIDIEEANPYMSIEYEGKYMHVSRYGRILEVDQGEPAANTFQILGLESGTYSKGDFIKEAEGEKQDILNSINSLLELYEFTDITCVDITNTVDITITYQNRIHIKVGSITELDYKVKTAKHIIGEYVTPTSEGEIEFFLEQRRAHFIPKTDTQSGPYDSSNTDSSSSTSSANSDVPGGGDTTSSG